MLFDLAVVRDAMMEVCREEEVQLYKVLGTCELLGLKAAMEEDEVERLLGSHPVHMTENGYVVLAEQLVKAVTNLSQLFVGEKREREREEYGGSVDIGGWRRKTHDWLFSEVSGTGARKDSRFNKFGTEASGSGAMVKMGYGENRRFFKR
jgi:hypothetical protein